MQRKLSLLLFASFSLVSCRGEGPAVTVCLIDSVNNSLQCSDADGNVTELPVADAGNYVCLSPDDFEILLNYAKKRCQ
jgi:hypothetical protein